MADGGALCETKEITVKSVVGERFDKIIGYDLGEKPKWDETIDTVKNQFGGQYINIEDIPF